MSSPVPRESTMNLYHEMIKNQKAKADQIKHTTKVIEGKDKEGIDATALCAHLADLQYGNKSLLLQISIEEKDFQKLDATPERIALNEMEYTYKRHGISSFKLLITSLTFNDAQTTEPTDVDELSSDPRSIQLPVTPMHINASSVPYVTTNCGN